MKLILSIGIPDKKYYSLEEGFRYREAIIQIVDWEKKVVEKEIKYTSPSEHLGYNLSMMFKGAYIYQRDYFVVTNTEVLRYNLDNWELECVTSHKSFNDLHGLLVDKDFVYVCNTGLELAQLMDRDGTLINEINVASTPTWKRFSRFNDYRKIATTKPHEMHLNHLFIIKGELWGTCFNKGGAFNLTNNNEKIEISQDVGCHDGIVKNDSIYFSTVNGHIIRVDKNTLRVVKDLDVNNHCNKNLGWTRGLEINDDQAFFGNTAIRKSKYEEYCKWVVKGPRSLRMQSSVLQVDLNSGKIIDTYNIKKDKGAAIYTILRYPE